MQKPAVGSYQTENRTLQRQVASKELFVYRPLLRTVAGEATRPQTAGRGTGPGFPDAYLQFLTLQGNADSCVSVAVLSH